MITLTRCVRKFMTRKWLSGQPVYYYSCSGQMKTMIDRANPLYDSDYKVTDVYLLATAAEDEPSTVNGTVKAVQGWVDCFDRMTLKGTVFAGGVNERGDIKGIRLLTKPTTSARQLSEIYKRKTRSEKLPRQSPAEGAFFIHFP